MSLDRSVIDANRKLQGLDPISDEEFTKLTGGTPPTPPNNDTPPAGTEVIKEVLREPTEEEMFKMLSEKTGKTVSSWDDLKDKEIVDEEKKKEERETNKLSFGLQNKIISKKEYEGYIADGKDARDLVYRYRLQEAQMDADFDQKTFDEEFNEEFGLEEKTDSRRYKNGQKTLKNLADGIMRSTYASVYNLDAQYTAFENQQIAASENAKKVKAGLPAFSKALENVAKSLKKITAQFGDDEVYEVEVLDDSINQVLSLMSEPKWVESQILEGYTEASLTEIANTALLKNNWSMFAKKMIDQALLKKAAGSKGVLRIDAAGKIEEDMLTDEQKVLKSLIEQEKQKQASPAAN